MAMCLAAGGCLSFVIGLAIVIWVSVAEITALKVAIKENTQRVEDLHVEVHKVMMQLSKLEKSCLEKACDKETACTRKSDTISEANAYIQSFLAPFKSALSAGNWWKTDNTEFFRSKNNLHNNLSLHAGSLNGAEPRKESKVPMILSGAEGADGVAGEGAWPQKKLKTAAKPAVGAHYAYNKSSESKVTPPTFIAPDGVCAKVFCAKACYVDEETATKGPEREPIRTPGTTEPSANLSTARAEPATTAPPSASNILVTLALLLAFCWWKCKLSRGSGVLIETPKITMEAFVKQLTGKFSLHGKQGTYTCEINADTAVLKTDGGEQVGTFTCHPVQWPANAFPLKLDDVPNAEIPVVGICDSEIIAEIQKPENDGAYFVLPSQLNGAEYPDPSCVVSSIEEYKYDNTGGPRGQLAVHPAAGQFILDNAACDGRPDGINAIDQLLDRNPEFRLRNGYLEMPLPDSERESKELFTKFSTSVSTLRPLTMSGVPACGLTPSKQMFSNATHKVNLVYASAVPVETYNNRPTTQVQKNLQRQIAEGILVAQYYSALRTAADRAEGTKKAKVFLTPLGGGVFNNSFDSIGKSISKALEMLTCDDRAKLVVQVLTWDGNRQEKMDMHRILGQFKKLQESPSRVCIGV